ncbi:MAG: antibiotic biosynthesis monooxygenase [bacterium]
MIGRIWHGWTTPENADRYQQILTTEVIPGIAAMNIKGFQRIQVLRREHPDEVEFVTIMWFDSLDSVRDFVGEDYERAHVPGRARQVLSRFDARSQHYEQVAQFDY